LKFVISGLARQAKSNCRQSLWLFPKDISANS